MANKKKPKKTKLNSKKMKKAKGAGRGRSQDNKGRPNADVGQQMLDRGVVTRTGRIC